MPMGRKFAMETASMILISRSCRYIQEKSGLRGFKCMISCGIEYDIQIEFGDLGNILHTSSIGDRPRDMSVLSVRFRKCGEDLGD